MMKFFFVAVVLVFGVQDAAFARVMMIPPTEKEAGVSQSADMMYAPQALVAPSTKGLVASPGQEQVADNMVAVEQPVAQSFPLLRALAVFAVLILGLLVFIKLRKQKS